MLRRMYAVERLGSYITRGVYTVSGPFHPFGGAVDIIVVEQQDGSFKTSPWYVRFGKFQGVLKTREKEVIINVNGVNADFNMYLDHKGEAYFLKEVDVEEPGSILYQSSSGEDTDGNKSNERRPSKSKSCNFDAAERDLNLPRSGSRRARLLGLVFGRKSVKGNNFEQGEGATDMIRANSLERAEIAADLLDVKWSTDLATKRPGKDKASRFSGPSMLDQNLEFSGEEIEGSQTVQEIIENYIDCPVQHDKSAVEVTTPEIEVNSVLYVETSQSCVGNTEHDNQETNSGDEKEVFEGNVISEDSRSGLCNTNEKLSEIISNDVVEESSNDVDDLKDESEIELRQGLNISSSERYEDEQFIFSDLDNLKVGEVLFTESIPPEFVEKLNLPSPTYLANESSGLDHELLPSSDKKISLHIDIVRSHPVGVEGVTRRAESLPNLWSHVDDELGVQDIRQHCHSLNLDTKSSKWILLRKNVSAFIKSKTEVEKQLAEVELATSDNQISGDLLNIPTNLAVDSYEGDPSKLIVAPTGSWGMWPFSFKRSTTLNATLIEPNVSITSDVENVLEIPTGTVRDKTELKSKATKKKIKLITPTSEQLSSLNLKPGKNIVTFTFSTAMLGKQQVDARIYLWRWNTRIVISDVDGTITKSDVLGQFMPWVGIDWSQTGVAHFFTDIKDNGYQLLFLSARAISQAYLTRQFLFNLKQDGKALPDGPVVISPDGLFPSLFREVIRRAPHEFKIACLENIKALFPSDCSPFYAGFGNRDTDEISYLKVGIPKGKIFIINPKGEVAVNHRVDTKSYPSLRTLVHDMFPPISSTEQEDFNSWNFWKLP